MFTAFADTAPGYEDDQMVLVRPSNFDTLAIL
jgi:hypothetical protein